MVAVMKSVLIANDCVAVPRSVIESYMKLPAAGTHRLACKKALDGQFVELAADTYVDVIREQINLLQRAAKTFDDLGNVDLSNEIREQILIAETMGVLAVGNADMKSYSK